jgi:hypothetical protein
MATIEKTDSVLKTSPVRLEIGNTMRGKYDQIEADGQTRTRSQKQTVVTPSGGIPSIEICEQDMIKIAGNGEVVLRETPAFSVALTAERLAKQFQLRNPVDDTLLGQEVTGNQAMAFYYSFIRDCQLERDAAQVTAQVIEEGEV